MVDSEFQKTDLRGRGGFVVFCAAKRQLAVVDFRLSDDSAVVWLSLIFLFCPTGCRSGGRGVEVM